MRPVWSKNAFVYLLIIVAIIALFYNFLSPMDNAQELAISEVAQYIKDGNVQTLEFTQDGAVALVATNGTRYTSRKEPGIGIGETLRDLGVTAEQLAQVDKVVAVQPSLWENWGLLLVQIVPMVLIGLFLVFMLRQAQSGNNQAMSFGKSRARMFTGDRPTSTFDDVAGADEAKQELARSGRVPERAEQVHGAGRAHSQGRAAGGAARHGQDADGPRRGWRGRRALL